MMTDEQFNLARVSFGTIGLVTGVALLIYGFGAYFDLLPGGSLSALMLIYGFPATIVGFALKYAELKPVPCKTTPQAMSLRDTKATDIQKQVRQDTTRYRYGDEQHLEEALERIFRYGKAEGIPRRYGPELRALREEIRDGEYALVLEFESPRLTAEQWMERQGKFQTFFGPGIVAEMNPVPGGMDVALITDGSGQGKGGKEQEEVLPPLMPGMPARRKD